MSDQFIPSCVQQSSGIVVNPTSTSLTLTQELDADIVQVLDGTGSYPGCIGGLTQDEILSRLQAEFPDADWDATILQSRLRAGLREGRFCRISATRYGMRRDMAIVNNANSVFIPFSDNITVPRGMLGVQASVDFVFEGNVPCSRRLTNAYYATAVSITEPQLIASAFLSNNVLSE